MKILKNNKIFKIITVIVVYIFASIGLLFFVVFVAMRLHLTDVKGSIDSRNDYFKVTKTTEGALFPVTKKEINSKNFNKLNSVTECQIIAILSVLPKNGEKILDTYMVTKSSVVTEKMINAIMLVTNNNLFLKEKINKCEEIGNNVSAYVDTPFGQSIFSWMSSPEWKTLRDALIKDKDVIIQASIDSGVSARMIVSAVISEQFRFFTSNRDSYKRYFEPLKVLGNGTKFSYGVAGVKFETAKIIESNLKNQKSPFYLGFDNENIFNYGDKDPDTELLNRLTDTKNHYYSYLYTAIFLKQIMHQWEEAGYSIKDRPEVLSTLFNLGFYKSIPKEDPEAGGSTIIINDRDYTFGGLSYEFYYSGELSDIFPFETQNN